MLRLAFIATLAIMAFGACDGGSDDDDESPTAVASASATVDSSTPDGAQAIRSYDVESNADVQAVIADTAGSVSRSDILYADLTADGIEEAVVPIASGGTLGNVAFIVLTPDGDDAATLLTQQPADTRGVTLEVDGGNLVATEPVPGPDDPECCPSMLRKTTYAWNGEALALDSVDTVPNPDGGVKGTPTATS
jgi:hypothetical protein